MCVWERKSKTETEDTERQRQDQEYAYSCNTEYTKENPVEKIPEIILLNALGKLTFLLYGNCLLDSVQ